MVSACILICCEAGRHADLARRIKDVKGVVRAFSVSGRWDVIADVETSDLRALSEVALRINGLPGIRVTETLVEAAV